MMKYKQQQQQQHNNNTTHASIPEYSFDFATISVGPVQCPSTDGDSAHVISINTW